MRVPRFRVQWTGSLLFLCARLCSGGTYLGTAACSQATGCLPVKAVSGVGSEVIDPRGIAYPMTFELAGVTSANLKVCVDDAFDGNLGKAVEWAVAKWNALIPAVNNCVRCTTQEVGNNVSGPDHLPSTVLHEIGHCAMGLGHTTLIIDTADDPDTCTNPPPPPLFCREFTSFTVSYGGTSSFNGLLAGLDQVKGSKDDTQLAQNGGRATNVHWFRRFDNDPIVADVTPIDSLTYSPVLGQLPLGSSYTANANVGVGNLLGNSQTTTVMERSRNKTAAYFELSADDVNMVWMSRNGLNRLIGPAGALNDDHSISIEVVPCAAAHDIKISAASLPSGVIGGCDARVDYLFPLEPHGNLVDYILTGQAASPQVLNVYVTNVPAVTWSFGIPIFYGSFENGTYDLGWIVSP